jgi:2-polyprenyl-6-methoxyphenol hydroxylase-like FAD-dependent oxidoreductase
MDWSVQKTEESRAAYVVGADGPNSFLAKLMGVGYETVGQPEFFAVYECQSDWKCDDELRVVFDQGTTNVLWPLPENKFRWSFQLLEEHLREFPSKERSSLIIGDPAGDRANNEFVQKLLRQRAPWFKSGSLDLGWSTDVEFEHRIAKRFGEGRCWLVGDAAHQTGPAGMQSMNIGLIEAEELAGTLKKLLHQQGLADLLEAYHQKRRSEWRQLLGMAGGPKPRAKTDSWIKEHSARILPCLPASGDELSQLLGQLELDLS